MKGQLSLVFKMKVELEFIQVNLKGRSRSFDHFYPHGPGGLPGSFQGSAMARKESHGAHREDYIRKVIMKEMNFFNDRIRSFLMSYRFS